MPRLVARGHLLRRVSSPGEMIEISRNYLRASRRVALVPTMGYLHAGHLSLVEQARDRSDFVVMSVFVNPLQFGAGEDFAAYPRDLERDAALAEKAEVDCLFTPEVEDLHPSGHRTTVEVSELGSRLCGASRPGHFRGVATVVAKLLAIVDPEIACFGEKDFQQLVLLRRMARDLGFRAQVIGCPIVREPDGLAMSSRNVYLSPEERRAAVVLSRALLGAREAFAAGERDVARLRARLAGTIADEPLARLDYAELVDPGTLQAAAVADADTRAVLAAWLGRTRLIDNAPLGDERRERRTC